MASSAIFMIPSVLNMFFDEHSKFALQATEYVTPGGRVGEGATEGPVKLCDKDQKRALVNYQCGSDERVAISRPFLLESDASALCNLPKDCDLLKDSFINDNEKFKNLTEDCGGLPFQQEASLIQLLVNQCNFKIGCFKPNVTREELYENPFIMQIAGYPIMLVDHYENQQHPYKCVRYAGVPVVEPCTRRQLLVDPGKAIYVQSPNYPELAPSDTCQCMLQSQPKKAEIWILHLEHRGIVRKMNRIFVTNYVFQPIYTTDEENETQVFEMPAFFPQIETDGRQYRLWMIVENRNTDIQLNITCGHQG